MCDLIFGPVKNLSSSLWSSMADIADKIDDLICSFEGGGDSTMDTLAMLVFSALVVVLIVGALCKYVYFRFIKKVPVTSESEKKPTTEANALVKPDPAVDGKVEPKVAPVVVPKSTTVRSSGSGGGGGGKFVPPTPPLRKRLTAKKGAGPTPAGARTAPSVPPPTGTGPDAEAVRWVNALLSWLYCEPSALDELISEWIHTLNDLSKKSVEEHGVGVEVIRLLPETHPPSITNVFIECAPNDDITITCDCDATPALQVKALRQKGEKVQVSHYRLNVNRFRARMTAFCITEKFLCDIRCDGWPEIKVALAPVGSIKSNLDEQSLQDVIADILVTAMRGAQVHFNIGSFPDCPRFSRYVPPPAHILPVHYDSMAEEMAAKSKIHPVPPPDQKLGDKRLLVKVLHARGLMAGTQDPYCIVEMDEPPQKNQTCVKKNTDSPIWDEHFLFDVSSGTCELLLEVHDRATKRFLGLGIVGVEELLINPNQRQTITLQPKPYETDSVTGTLTVEFMFIEGTEIPIQGRPYKLKETLRSVTPSGNIRTTSKTLIAADGKLSNGGETVAETALRELQTRVTNPSQNGTNPANKTTLIIHSVQRHASVKGEPARFKVEKKDDGTWKEVEPVKEKQGIQDADPGQDISVNQINPNLPEGRSRSRRKKRDFFGTIKRRLERSRGRSKSVGPDGVEQEGDALTRSISADRVRDASAHSTVPSLRVTDGELSRRSSVSDLSGVSGASTRTFIHEASTLVLETTENGISKHYLIPLSLAQKSKWRKRGTKLHIFNDHTFIAKHMPAKTTCQVCATLIPRRFGKQAYECRDCLIKCHKACHVRADHSCPQSTIQSIELTKFISSPMLDKRFLPPISPRSKKPANGK